MNEELVVQKIVEYGDQLERIEERLEKVEKNTEVILTGQDKMISILERVDQERVFTNIRMERFEKELNTIKARLP